MKRGSGCCTIDSLLHSPLSDNLSNVALLFSEWHVEGVNLSQYVKFRVTSF